MGQVSSAFPGKPIAANAGGFRTVTLPLRLGQQVLGRQVAHLGSQPGFSICQIAVCRSFSANQGGRLISQDVISDIDIQNGLTVSLMTVVDLLDGRRQNVSLPFPHSREQDACGVGLYSFDGFRQGLGDSASQVEVAHVSKGAAKGKRFAFAEVDGRRQVEAGRGEVVGVPRDLLIGDVEQYGNAQALARDLPRR